MMISDIPQDLIEEILSRVPAASLKRLRSTCKRWNDLFEDGRFAEKHLRKAPKESRILMLDDAKIRSLNVDLNVAPPAVEFEGPFCKHLHIAEIFHCDGLLLCRIKNDKRLMIWNPCLGETRWIETTTTHDSEDVYDPIFALGYQNNKSCRSYKILEFWNGIPHKEAFEIYELSSDDSWRVLDDDSALICGVEPNCGVSFKGNAYWIALEKRDQLFQLFLVGFDFTRESFRRFSLPPLQDSCDIFLSVVREEQLSLLHISCGASHMEVWVTHEIDDTQPALWNKSFIVEMHTPYDFSLVILSFLIIDEEKKVALALHSDKVKLCIFGEDNEYFIEIPFVDSEKMFPFIFSYVPSLVRVPSPFSSFFP